MDANIPPATHVTDLNVAEVEADDGDPLVEDEKGPDFSDTADEDAPAIYYDPYAKCIKFQQGACDADGVLTLSGVIVEGDLSIFGEGKTLMGEIIEIIDPNEQKEEDPDDDGANEAGGLLTGSFIEGMQLQPEEDDIDASQQQSKELLLQKQRQLQSIHAQEHQKLMRKQQKDWVWFHSKNLSEKRLFELEGIHQKETLDMQSRQQREQQQLVNFIFDCMSMSKHEPRKKKETMEMSTQTLDASATAAQAVAASLTPSVEAVFQPLFVPKGSVVERDQERADSSESTAAAEAVEIPHPAMQAAVRIKKSPNTPKKERALPSLPDKISLDRQKADEIKAVMRDGSLSRTERKQKLAEIKEKYANSGDNTAVTKPKARPMSRSPPRPVEKSFNTGQRRQELQGVMRDKSLGKEEKQKRMAEIHAKYAAKGERDNNRKASQEKIDEMKAKVAKSKEQSRSREGSKERPMMDGSGRSGNGSEWITDILKKEKKGKEGMDGSGRSGDDREGWEKPGMC